MTTLEATTMRKVAWRLVPFLCLLYTVAFVDRINVGFAALSMRADLDLSASAFGFGAGLFFLGYFIFEIPSNLVLHRVGARLWIARIMITWGLVSAGTGFIVGHNSFYALRFLLGAAEAGFFPGVILYLTYWFPKSYRGRVTAGFMIAIPISSVIAAQVSTQLLQVHALGLKSWQWMFLVEGIPPILLGFVVLRLLTDRPADATWLTDAERTWLVEAMDQDRVAAEATEGGQDHGLGDVLRSLIDWRVLRLALLYFGLTTGLYGIEFWLPQIVKGFGLSTNGVGAVVTIPYVVAIASMLLWARYSDKTGNRANHVAGACCIASTGMVLAAMSSAHPIGIVLFLAVAIAGVMAARPPFWSLPTQFLAGRKAAAAIAAINSIGNLGGLFGTTLIGYVRDQTGGFALGLVISALILFVMALLTPSLGRSAKAPARPQATPHYHSSGGPIA